jgi:hypothetical protein
MGFTTYANDKILNAYGQSAALGGPATHYVGLLTATTWAATSSYTLGAYVIPTTFGSITGQQGKIFKCTTGGTSGGSQPTWTTTEGGTNADNTATWTEASLLFQAGTFTAAEVAGNNYGRAPVTANSTNFPNASSAEPAVLQNGTAITFPTPSAAWGFAVGFLVSDASTAGNVWAWGAMTSALDCPSGSTPSFGVNALQLQMSALLTA